MRLMFLGDLHGNFNLIGQYIDMYKIKNTNIIQVGDFGLGFNVFFKEKRMLELYHPKLVKNNVHIYAIAGNHDYRPYFNNDPFEFTNIHLVPDYTVLNFEDEFGLGLTKNVLCLGGAVSVDRNLNKTKHQFDGDFDTKTGYECWWPDEPFVFDRDKLGTFRDIDIIVTHTCPDYCPPDNAFGLGGFVEGIIAKTGDEKLRTDLLEERYLMKEAFTILKMNNDIQNHYYAHFHKSDVINLYGTKHRLLNVGELYEER